MIRRRRWWLLALLLASLATGIGLWSITQRLLAFEAEAIRAAAESARTEVVRLALWRMDASMAPRLAREAARPVGEYASFFAPQTVNRLLQVVPQGEVLAASPLLAGSPEWIRLHFEIASDGAVTSPQVPEGRLRDLAEGQYLPGGLPPARDESLAALRACVAGVEDSLAEVASGAGEAPSPALAPASSKGSATGSSTAGDPTPRASTAPVEDGAGEPAWRDQSIRESIQRRASASDSLANSALEVASPRSRTTPLDADREALARKLAGGAATTLDASSLDASELDASRLGALGLDAGIADSPSSPGAAAEPEVALEVGPFVPSWISQSPPILVFVREVREGGSSRVQGFLVDWAVLRGSMLDEIEGLFDRAELLPTASRGFSPTRLASVPAELEAGAALAVSPPPRSSTRSAILLAWAAGGVALLAAVAATLAGLSFGERQARFASSVTHELRTPLTTFQLYSEMLRDGMIPDEARRADCLEVLCRESRRLGHLVENVLSLARLERGSARSRDLRTLDEPALDALLREVAAERAPAAETSVRTRLDGGEVAIDQDLLLQILGNLLENAVKYGASPDGVTRVELDASREGEMLLVSVRDHGAGIPAARSRTIWRPFERGAAEDDPRPGLGLGLAVARGLAERLGGSLRLASAAGVGARFELRLPSSPQLQSVRST